MNTTVMNHALILGSNSDIGQAIAYQFAKQGFDIILGARKINEYQKRLASDIAIRHNVETTNLQFDGLDYNSHSNIIKRLPNFPNVVISVFGYLGNQETAEKNFEEASKIINANYTGHVSLLNLCAEEMVKKTIKGTIIGISSVAGERGRQSNYIYGSAKAAFSIYLDGLRHAMHKNGIHVVTVKPGFVKTKMIEGIETPKPLTATPKKVALAVFKSYKKKKNTIYVLPIWRLIMFVIKRIPEPIFKKLNL